MAAYGEVFERVGVRGTVCAAPLDGLDASVEVGFGAGEAMVAGSVFKVPVALTAERWFAEGRLDPREQVVLPAEGRTPGPVGFSLFADEVRASLRDLVALMLTISDNVATDALLGRTGVAEVNRVTAELGLTGTELTGDVRHLIDAIGRDAGFQGWQDMIRWFGTAAAEEERAAARDRLVAARELTPATATRTTARDMVRLLRLIWTDAAGPAAACARVRELMGRQLTRNRIAAGFGPEARVSVKSGGLAGVVRNEVGVVEYPDGRAYAVAVFTLSPAGGDDRPINAAIGEVAALAVAELAGS